MRGMVLVQSALKGKNLIGFEDGTVGFESDLKSPRNGSKLPWDFLLLPPKELKGETEVHLIHKIGPMQAGEVKLALKKMEVDGYELIAGHDPGEELWAYVDKSLQNIS